MSALPRPIFRSATDLKAAVERASLTPRFRLPGSDRIPAQAAQARIVAEARAVGVAYAGRPALSGVSLALARGEITVLLGPNGSGKTTLLQTLCGHVSPASGTVAVAGLDPGRSAMARRSIGLVPQDVALYPNLTTRENLEYFGRLSGLPRRDVRRGVEQVLRECRLTDVADRHLHTLSGGFQRRANLAVALVARPALLLLDEPTVGIDRDAAAAIGDVLKAQRAGGVAVLLVSHDLDQAAALADRVGIMVGGRLVREGPLLDLLGADGAGREIVVTLEGAPTQSRRALLASLDLTSRGDPLVWTAPCEGHGGSVDRVLAALREAGVAVREIGLRRRGLAAAYEEAVAACGEAG